MTLHAHVFDLTKATWYKLSHPIASDSRKFVVLLLKMGIVSTTILSLLVICSFSWRAEAFPVGCNKLTGTMEDAIPEEYIVKMKKGTLKEHIVKLMFEMTNSGCEGKITTTSSASKAVKGPIACSNLIYITGIGFAAKMSDAAVMWVSPVILTIGSCRI